MRTSISRTVARILQRLALFALMLWIVSVVIFLALRVLPGDVAAIVAGTNSTQAQYEALRTQLGLDQPLIVQYGRWLGQVISSLWTGDLGTSLITGEAMSTRLASRAAVTFPLILLSMVIALVVGIWTAVASLTSPRAWVRDGLRVLAQVCGAVPALWAGLLLILAFGRGSGLLGVLPTQGFSSDSLVSAAASLLLPALSVGLITGAQFSRYTRSALLEVEKDDYLTWSMAAGMTYAQAVRSTGLRLATPQIISVAGVTFASMITGVLTVESLFNLPGLATILLSDISERDLPAVQTELLLLAAFFLAVGFVIDVVQAWLDPRMAGVSRGTEVQS
ncbi:ABC transporter permease [Alloscardovia macacae]|uniref:ABC transporter permease n=1 Tax=Alloscardovia macacae TaxID=1160091 RepID=A0A261F667_9BIFI|nr:ABC transporter permease [Alloscardovia macacae]OZG54611.1 ABC transporter permease [Alloscardovia macacae]